LDERTARLRLRIGAHKAWSRVGALALRFSATATAARSIKG
jgi:hypothetical protein